MLCTACTTEVPDDDLFCENCGTDLRAARTATPGACTCGAGDGEVDEEGFCERCGRRVRRPPSDHIEEALSPACAAVSDRGIRHDRNEDRFGIFASDGAHALVVCDGVSATPNAEVASGEVTAAVLASLSEAIRQGAFHTPETATRNASETAMRAAVAAGLASLTSLTAWGDDENMPSTTAVAALVVEGVATIGWVGDSRAYWIRASGAAALTTDHSWRNDVVATGQMTEAEADAAPQAHAITRWIGADSGEAAEPDIVQHQLTPGGTLLLCTDGLWNYAATPQAMAETLRAAESAGEEALGTARRLIQFALDCGGKDNITVALLRVAGEPQPLVELRAEVRAEVKAELN